MKGGFYVMKINFKNKRFIQYQLEFYQKKKLDYSTRELYSFIYTHCHYHDNGWCGFSNEKLAEMVKTSVRTVEDNLKKLRDKEMIIIENPGKRTKKTGESRQIHINAKNYIIEDVPEAITDNELLKVIEKQNKELEELKKENNQLRFEQTQSVHITELGHSLIRTGFITEARYQEQAQEINHILLDFESWHKEGRGLTKSCFSYWNTHKDGYIKNPVKYVLTCIEASKTWISKRKDVTAEEYSKELEALTEGWQSDEQ